MKKLLLFGIAAGAAFLTGLTLFHLGMLVFIRSGAEIKVPDLVGLDQAGARRQLESLGFNAVIDREEHSLELGEGRILEQRPSPGEVLRKGRKIWLTVSLGYRRAEVPNVVGLTYRQAGIVLRADELAVGGVLRLRHDTVSRGTVVAQDPAADTSCPEGTRIALLVSLGTAPVSYVVPDLTGRSVRDVEALLTRHRLRVGEKAILIDRSVLPSTVLEHDPPAGSRLESGEEIHLVVSPRR